MKLLLYSHYFAPSIGGVETLVMSLARGLVEVRTANGAPEFALTLVTQTPREEFDDSALSFSVVRQPGFWKLRELVRGSDAMHIAGPSFQPLFLAWLSGKPTVVEHHAYQAICPNGLLIHQPERSVCPGYFQAGKYVKCLQCQSSSLSVPRSFVSVLAAFPRRALVRRIAANIAVTEHVRQRLALPRSAVVYHGIENTPEAGSPAKPKAASKICFAYVGRFVQEKGIPVFLAAISELRKQGLEFEAILVGDGPERSSIEAQLDAGDLRSIVRITGYLSPAAVAATMADVQVVVMPSVWEETAGFAAIEQLMRGRLVIASDIGGLAEIAGDVSLKFPAGDANALAARMRAAIENPGMIEELGARAQASALTRFSRSRMISEHGAIYRKIWTEQKK